ncbi:MAG: hypothetical protein K8R02_04170 [Anaerohalosphaeraceae bacterium]|nr:hypothetical protein [Anaerohalosphaeraceae bacterium]
MRKVSLRPSIFLFVFFACAFTTPVFAENPDCGCGQSCGACSGQTAAYMQVTLTALQGCPQYFHDGAAAVYPGFGGVMDIICKQDGDYSCGYHYIGPVFNMDGFYNDYRFYFYLDFNASPNGTEFIITTQEDFYGWYDAFYSVVSVPNCCSKIDIADFFSYCNGPTPDIYSGTAYWRPAILADGNCPSCEPNSINQNCDDLSCETLGQYTAFAGGEAFYDGPIVLHSPPTSQVSAKAGNTINSAKIYCPNADLVSAEITSTAPNDVIVSVEPQNCSSGDTAIITVRALRGSATVECTAIFYQRAMAEECIVLKTEKTVTIEVRPDDGDECGQNFQKPVLLSGSPGNVSTKIRAGVNPLDEWPCAKLYESDNYQDIEVILPGRFTPIVFNDGKAPAYLAGYRVQVQQGSRIIASDLHGSQFIYDEADDYKISLVKSPCDVNIIEFIYDANGLPLRQNDLTNTDYYISYLYDSNGLMSEIREYENATDYRRYVISYDGERVSGIGNGCGECGQPASARRYSYNDAGLLEFEKSSDEAILYQYAYDSDGRLTEKWLGTKTDSKPVLLTKYQDNPSGYIADTNEYVDLYDCRITREIFEASGQPISKTIFQQLGDNPDSPSGQYYTEEYIYDRNAASGAISKKTIIYPSGARTEFIYDVNSGELVEQNVYDSNDVAINLVCNSYQYLDPNGQPTSDPNQLYVARLIETFNSLDANTAFSYTSSLLSPSEILYPISDSPLVPSALRSEYIIDDYDRTTSVNYIDRQSEAVVLTTNYTYDDFGNLISGQYADGNDVNEVTAYEYNSFNELIRTQISGGTVFGKSYNQKGQIVSEFTLVDSGDIHLAEPNLMSQVRYTYDANGNTEMIAEAISGGEFAFGGPEKWVYTKFEYDSFSQVTQVVEDVNGCSLATFYDYNYQGELVKTTESSGKWTEYIRDGRGMVVYEIDGFGQDDLAVAEFEYDAAGNLIKRSSSEGIVYRFEYDDFDRPVEQRFCSYSGPNLWVQRTEYEYNNAGNLTGERVYDSNNTIVAEEFFGYDCLSRLWQKRVAARPGITDDTNDMVVLYARNYLGNVTTEAIKNVDSVFANSIDETNDILIMADYDSLGREKRLIDPLGNVTDFDRGADGQILSITNACGLATVNTYDLYGRVGKVTTPDGHYLVFDYDSLDRVIRQAVFDCNGTPATGNDDYAIEQKRFEYDNLGNLSRTVVMTSAVSTADVNIAIDAVTDYDYNDVTGLLETQISYYNGADIVTTEYFYDLLGRLTKIVDTNDNASEVFYDVNFPGRIYKQQFVYNGSAESTVITTYFNYDDYGRVISSRLDNNGSADFNDLITHFCRDGLGRIVKEISPSGLVTEFEYDVFGNLVKTIQDPNGLCVVAEHCYNRLSERVVDIAYDPNVQQTQYEYDKNARPIKIIYPDSKTAEYFYDGLGRICEQKNRNGESIYYGYNGSDDLIWQSDDPNGPLGDVNSCDFLIEFEYSPTGRITYAAKTVTGETIAKSYFEYDGLGNITKEIACLYGFAPKTIEYTRDQTGNVFSISLDSESTTYSYDGLGRVRVVGFNNVEIACCDYFGPALKTIFYPQAGIENTYGYDEIGRISQCKVADANDDAIIDYIYAYNEFSSRKMLAYNHIPGAVQDSYSYDSLGRISDVNYGLWGESEEYNYDGLGNRSVVNTRQGSTDTYYHNQLNQYTKVHTDYNFGGLTSDADIHHDDNGNILSEEINGFSYEFDSLGNVIKVTHNSEVIIEFAYDALGRRIYSKNQYLSEKLFYYDLNNRVIAEYDIGGSGPKLSRNYVYGNGQTDILAMFLPERVVDSNDVAMLYEFCDSYLLGVGEPGYNSDYDYDDNEWVDLADYAAFASENSFHLPGLDETRWYYLKDALGSVAGIVGAKFNRPGDREFYKYDAFGKSDRLSDVGNPYFFAGYSYDEQIDKYYCNNRYYDSLLGRFLSPDKLGYADGLNLYEYAQSNPIMFSDPLGLKSSLKQELQFLLGFGNVRRRVGLLTGNVKKNCEFLQLDCDTTRCQQGQMNSQCGKADRCFNIYRKVKAGDDALNSQCAKAVVYGTVVGTTQGLLNTANGVQDSLIGTVNLGSGIWNYTGALIYDKKLGYIESPDWSKDLIVKESDFAHGASKFLGSEGALALATAGLSHWKNAHQLTKIQKTAPAAREVAEGIYEFTASSGKTYVGQSGNVTNRIVQHIKSGKLLTKDVKTLKATKVGGGKVAREIYEQLRINKLGGIDKLENMKNAIGPARQYLLKK